MLRLAVALLLCPVGLARAGPPARRWPDDAVLPLTGERIALLPVAQQAAWRSYLATSVVRARDLPPVSSGEGAPAGPQSTPPTRPRRRSSGSSRAPSPRTARNGPEPGAQPSSGDAAQAAEAAERLHRGVDCILDTQIRTPDGRRTVWGQQHDSLTGRPCAARNFEPMAASALESASICQFLMSLPETTPAMSSALDDAVAWFGRVALHDVEWHRATVSGNGLLAAPGAPPL